MKTKRFAITLLLALLILLPLTVRAEAGRPLYAVKGDNGKWGYIDSLGNWAIEPQYDEAGDFRGDYAVTAMYPEDADPSDEYAETLDGIIDVTGAWVLEPLYDILSVSDSGEYAGGRDGGYFQVSRLKNSAWEQGWFNIPNGYYSGFLYERVYIEWGESEACTGPALEVTEAGGAWAFVDRFTGEYLIPPQEDWSPAGAYAEGFVPVKNGDAYALLSGNGAVIPLPEGYRFSEWNHDRVSQGLIPVEETKTGLLGFLDTAGRIAIAPQFQYVSAFGADGVACVQFPEGDYGHIDTAGCVLYRGASQWYSFSRGLAAVPDDSADDTMICIRPDGTEAFRVTAEGLSGVGSFGGFDENGIAVYTVWKTTEHYMAAWDWTYSTYRAHGLVNDRGEVLTGPDFLITEERSDGTLFAEGLAAMSDLESLLVGFIDMNGQWVIPPQYDYAQNFRDGLAWAQAGNTILFIDREGNTVFSWNNVP